MADQLIGQWWAHQLGLGYILPKDKVQTALRSIFKYNWLTDMTGFKQSPRAFAGDGDKGLLIVTWPKGGRPGHVMLYSDEVWTGIEYQVAGHMIYEGMIEEAYAIIKGARDRYDGIPRAPIGRNPWNEIECGGHYARAMSNWSLLTGAVRLRVRRPDQDATLHAAGHAGEVQVVLRRAGRLGLAANRAKQTRQPVDEIRVVEGRLPLAEVQLATPANVKSMVVLHWKKGDVVERLADATFEPQADGVTVKLRRTFVLTAGERLQLHLVLSKEA